MAVSYLGLKSSWGFQTRHGDQIDVLCCQGTGIEAGFGTEDHRVVFRADFLYVHRLRQGEAKACPLTEDVYKRQFQN